MPNSAVVAFAFRFRRSRGGPASPAGAAPPLPPERAAEFHALRAQCESQLRAKAVNLCRSARPGAFDAEDLLQDTYERALRAFASYNPAQPPQAWFGTILVNRFNDLYRSQKRHPQESLTEEVDMANEPEESASPWDRFTLEDVARAVERLPDEFRAVVRLKDLEGLSYAEIAERLGIPRMTVGTRLYRGRKRLKDLIMGKDGSEGDA